MHLTGVVNQPGGYRSASARDCRTVQPMGSPSTIIQTLYSRSLEAISLKLLKGTLKMESTKQNFPTGTHSHLEL